MTDTYFIFTNGRNPSYQLGRPEVVGPADPETAHLIRQTIHQDDTWVEVDLPTDAVPATTYLASVPHD